MVARTPDSTLASTTPLARRHLLLGWAGLLIFLSLGVILELLHGLKLNFYLDARNTTRRLMWTLAHAHGTLFSLIQIAFALSLPWLHAGSAKALRLVSRCLIGGLLLMPAGFFLGGLRLYGGDPGIGIILVPVGALMMLVATGAFFGMLWRNKDATESNVQRKNPGVR